MQEGLQHRPFAYQCLLRLDIVRGVLLSYLEGGISSHGTFESRSIIQLPIVPAL